mmetsp:Transcript_6726/g.20105  ORF Transcript_6726/g.20105 Transcript_6726/m.20105 type:complete len:209 (-) Transcript_6726:365-991(-)
MRFQHSTSSNWGMTRLWSSNKSTMIKSNLISSSSLSMFIFSSASPTQTSTNDPFSFNSFIPKCLIPKSTITSSNSYPYIFTLLFDGYKSSISRAHVPAPNPRIATFVVLSSCSFLLFMFVLLFVFSSSRTKATADANKSNTPPVIITCGVLLFEDIVAFSLSYTGVVAEISIPSLIFPRISDNTASGVVDRIKMVVSRKLGISYSSSQ